MTEKQFIETYCNGCGTQRCEGIGSPWFEGCSKRWNLDGYGDAATEIERLNNKIMELGFKLVKLSNAEPVKHGKWIETGEYTSTGKHLFVCSECHKEDSWVVNRKKYCSECGAKMDKEE